MLEHLLASGLSFAEGLFIAVAVKRERPAPYQSGFSGVGFWNDNAKPAAQ
jgi:hypothetical protein